MKRFRYIILVIALNVLLSCENKLDKEPILNTTESKIFSSKERIEKNLLGVYGQSKKILALRTHVFLEARGDDFINLSMNILAAYSSYEMNVGMGSDDNSETWTGIYASINEVNTFLENLENAKSVAAESYSQYVSEAKFIRALGYYYLNNLYATPYVLDNNAKSVPLRLNAEKSITNNDMERASISQIYEQILEDLSEENIQALPNHSNDYNSVTRATKEAAYMLRMRIFMEQGLWEKSIAEGEKVINFSLEQDLSSIFTAPYISNESIFSFPMTETNRGSTQSAFAYYLYNGTRFILDIQSGIYGDPYYSLPEDQRISKLTSKQENQPISTKFADYQKYLDWIPLFRFAETKLNLAESYYRIGNEEKARELLLVVRRRAIQAANDPLNLGTITGSELFEAIDKERRTEFIGEAIRSIDIHRRGETYQKQKGTEKAITIAPGVPGYIWPIPTIERVTNSLIKD